MLIESLTVASVCMQWMQRWVRRCHSSLPAAHLPHLPQHDAVACPDSSPDAEAPVAMSLESEADMAADDIQHGQISRQASDSAANAPAASLPSESPASHPLALGVAALAAALSWPAYSNSAAAISAPEAPAADTLSPADIDETRLAALSRHCEECEQGEIEESDELCPAVNAPGISSIAACRVSFRSMLCSVCVAAVDVLYTVVRKRQGKHQDCSRSRCYHVDGLPIINRAVSSLASHSYCYLALCQSPDVV